MQTFLPYPSFAASAAALDGPRLGKQRVETFQLLRAQTVPGHGWRHHPAARMWTGHLPAHIRAAGCGRDTSPPSSRTAWR